MARVLVRSSEPPKSTLSQENTCNALKADGGPCKIPLDSDEHTWCNRHLQEMKDFNSRLGRLQNDAEGVEVIGPDSAMQKVLKLRLALDLRRQIRERFYSRGGDTVEFISWMTRLEQDLKNLVDFLLSEPNRGQTIGTSEDTPLRLDNEGQKATLLQRRARPQIHINTLQDVLDNDTTRILREFYAGICMEGLHRLYSTVPDLDDSGQRSAASMKDRTLHDSGTAIVRAWFRIMVLNDSDAEALQHATRSNGIDEFLSDCNASQLEAYCDFFENAWRPHALQYLRVAVCAQNPDQGDFKSITFLGGKIPSTTQGLKFRMEKPCWDIVYHWFPRLLSSSTLANICLKFDEYTTVCRLLMLGLYREHWFDPSSILTECTTGVYFGFIPSIKGDHTHTNGLNKEGEIFIQREARNYICGQMAIDDPSAQDLLDELIKRSERLLVIVYVGTNADPSLHPMEEDLFISRSRSATSLLNLENTEWTVDMTLEDLKNEARLQQQPEHNPIAADSCQFIIVDKQAALPFQLFDIIRDVTYARRRSMTHTNR